MCKIYGQKWAIRNSNKTGTDYAVETNKITVRVAGVANGGFDLLHPQLALLLNHAVLR